MNNQIKPSVTNPAIAEIYQDIKAGRLVLAPDFQRRFVWTTEHQDKFLDTIINGFPFPEIYVCEGDVDVDKIQTTRMVIDGQQRLTTIKRYIDGEHRAPPSKIKSFEELSEAEKKRFLSYQLVLRDIGKVDEVTIREIFRRINLTKFKLQDIEIHNAVYDGHFIQAAKKILENTELGEFGVFSDTEFTRMADLQFILLVMSTIECGGYFAQYRELETMISNYNEDYPNKDKRIEQLISTLSIIRNLKLPPDSIWFRKSNFFTLAVELANHIQSLPENLRERLVSLETNIMENKNNSDSEYSKYYLYMYQATQGRTARVTRAEFFKRDVLGLH